MIGVLVRACTPDVVFRETNRTSEFFEQVSSVEKVKGHLKE